MSSVVIIIPRWFKESTLIIEDVPKADHVIFTFQDHLINIVIITNITVDVALQLLVVFIV